MVAQVDYGSNKGEKGYCEPKIWLVHQLAVLAEHQCVRYGKQQQQHQSSSTGDDGDGRELGLSAQDADGWNCRPDDVQPGGDSCNSEDYYC